MFSASVHSVRQCVQCDAACIVLGNAFSVNSVRQCVQCDAVCIV